MKRTIGVALLVFSFASNAAADDEAPPVGHLNTLATRPRRA